jgi:hypothetical protein
LPNGAFDVVFGTGVAFDGAATGTIKIETTGGASAITVTGRLLMFGL